MDRERICIGMRCPVVSDFTLYTRLHEETYINQFRRPTYEPSNNMHYHLITRLLPALLTAFDHLGNLSLTVAQVVLW